VAVDPVFLQGVDGFGGLGIGELAVGVDAELGVGVRIIGIDRE
jgi:hypothetical protein